MIKLSNSSVMIINPDGSKQEFESDDLQTRIIKSCLAAGIKDAWIAEDISLAVEYALNSSDTENRAFAVSEINSMVLKILQETGYPEVAEKFKFENVISELEIKPDSSLLSELVVRHVGLSGKKLESVVRQLQDVAERLEIESASPLFFVELARLYSKKSLPALRKLQVPSGMEISSWSLSKEQIISGLSDKTRLLADAGILSFSGVSRFFPSLKIHFSMIEFAHYLKLAPPITELNVVPFFHIAAGGINDILETLEKRMENPGKNPVPVYLFISDMSSFASGYLGAEWPGARRHCREMISYLEEMLEHPLFRVKMK